MKSILVWLTILLFPCVAFAAPGTCTLTWDAPSTYDDGTPLAAPIDHYNLYMANQTGQQTDPPLAVVTAPPVTVPCQGKRYWIVTAVVGGVESGPSNEWLTQSAAPQNLRGQ